MLKLNNRQTLNYSIVVILTISIIIALFFIEQNPIFKKLIIVISFNIFIIVAFELWQLKSISLNKNEKMLVRIVTFFLKNEGFNNEEIYNFIKPYLYSYSKKQVITTINKCKNCNYKNHKSIIWVKRSIRIYMIFIIIDILEENGLRNNIEEGKIADLSEFILGNKSEYNFIDYYFLSFKNNKNFPLFKMWQKYKAFGLLPMNNNLFLSKVISRKTHKKEKEQLKLYAVDINKYQKRINESFSKYEPLTVNLGKIALVVISVIATLFSIYFLYCI